MKETNEIKEVNEKKPVNKKSIGYIIGQGISTVILSCLAICIASILIALTIKFVGWIF